MRDDLVLVVQRVVEAHTKAGNLDYCNRQDFIGMVNAVREAVGGLRGVKKDELHLMVAVCWLGPDSADIPPAAMRKSLLTAIRELESDHQKRLPRIMEFAIAYGCGKWRALAAIPGPWGQVWPGALRALARAITPAIRRVRKRNGQDFREGLDTWLAETVRGYPLQRDWLEITQEAATLAHYLSNPEYPLVLGAGQVLKIDASADGITVRAVGPFAENPYETRVPPGAKFVFRADTSLELHTPQGVVRVPSGLRIVVLVRGDDVWITPDTLKTIRVQVGLGQLVTVRIPGPARLSIWRCTCGNKNCNSQKHRLEGWDPRRLSLWAFVASAVKGPNCKLRLGSALQGMYLPMLAREGEPRVREVEVEVQICPCGEKYEGEKCRRADCKEGPFDSRRMRRISERRLVVDGVDPPAYRLVRRQRCRNRHQHYCLLNRPALDAPPLAKLCGEWDNLYEFFPGQGEAAGCPLCGQLPKRPRPTTVYVRTFDGPPELPDGAGQPTDDDAASAAERRGALRQGGRRYKRTRRDYE
jgi:hypothetical protein